MFKPSEHSTFNMGYNMLYDMFERFAPTLNTKSEVEKKKTSEAALRRCSYKKVVWK